MKLYKDSNDIVYAFEEDGSQDRLIGDKVSITEAEAEAILNPPLTDLELFVLQSTALANRTTKLLDDTVVSLGYDDMKSTRAYAGIPLLGTETTEELRQYNEAVSLAQWARKVWGLMGELEANATATIPVKTVASWVDVMPTETELIAWLPTWG